MHNAGNSNEPIVEGAGLSNPRWTAGQTLRVKWLSILVPKGQLRIMTVPFIQSHIFSPAILLIMIFKLQVGR